MKTAHLSNLFLVIMILGPCAISFAQSGKGKKGTSAAKSPLTLSNVEQRLKKMTFTTEQKNTLGPLIVRLQATLERSRKEFEVAVPESVRKARAEASKKLEAKGMKGDELREAIDRNVNMTPAQLDALKKFRNTTKELNDQLQKAAGSVLDRKQRSALGVSKTDKPNAASKTRSPLTLDNFIQRFGKIQLTDEQKRTLGPPVNKMRADLAGAQKEFESKVPEAIRNARAAASKKLEAKGLKGKKLREAVNQEVKLTGVQSVALQTYREIKKQLDENFRKACMKSLDPVQQKAVGL